MLDLKYVFPAYECVYVNTLPLENRDGFVRRRSFTGVEDRPGLEDEALHFAKIRITLQSDSRRFFTINQIGTLKEFAKSGLTVDKVSLFAMRPPELFFVNDIEFYFRNFTFERFDKSSTTSMYSSSLHKSCWLDAIGNIVKLRPQGLPSFKLFLVKSKHQSNSNYSLFSSFHDSCFSTSCNSNHLVDTSEKKTKDGSSCFS